MNEKVVETVLREYGTCTIENILVLAHIRLGANVDKKEIQKQLRALKKDNLVACSKASGEAVYWLMENSI